VIRVLIADDHAILRRGLKEILVRELAPLVAAYQPAENLPETAFAKGGDLFARCPTKPVFSRRPQHVKRRISTRANLPQGAP